jgi:hypothetical protein
MRVTNAENHELVVVQDYFVVIVSEYIYIPWKHSQDRAAMLAATSDGGFTSSTPSVTVSAGSDLEAQEVAYLKEQVQRNFLVVYHYVSYTQLIATNIEAFLAGF